MTADIADLICRDGFDHISLLAGLTDPLRRVLTTIRVNHNVLFWHNIGQLKIKNGKELLCRGFNPVKNFIQRHLLYMKTAGAVLLFQIHIDAHAHAALFSDFLACDLLCGSKPRSRNSLSFGLLCKLYLKTVNYILSI